MHIIIGVITALGGLIWAMVALQNAGVNLNSFNPYFWLRRHRWQKLYGTQPIYNLDSALDMAAALVVGVVKQEGDISREQKAELISLFQADFNLPRQRAVELFGASVHLLKDVIDFEDTVSRMMPRCKQKFTLDQATSLRELLLKAVRIEGDPNEKQSRLVAKIAGELLPEDAPVGQWQ